MLRPIFSGPAMPPAPKGDAALRSGAAPRQVGARSLAGTRRCPGARRRRARTASTLVTAVLGLAARASAEPVLPYTPTTILLAPDGAAGSGAAYIFAPSGDDRDAVDFLALNVSSLRASALEPTKLTPDLPFLSKDAADCATFAPTILRNGTIVVLAGDCSSTAASTLWSYTPGQPDARWTQHPVVPSASWDNAQAGPYHLGGLVNFSPQLSPVLSEPTLYFYGGMCPRKSSSSADTWQSNAAYSNRMLRLIPPSPPPSSSSSSSYTLDYASAGGQQQPPVAEAGFTWTELTPSLSNRTIITTTSDGGGKDGAGTEQVTTSIIITQQTSHVLLGGHTQGAFVNMSTAAVWSLPEETWTFVSIAPPPAASSSSSSSSSSDDDDDDGRADLARQRERQEEEENNKKKQKTKTKRRLRREAAAAAPGMVVDSRSGHTTVLSEDGTRLVVYGGWVGDVSRAAEPQLAVVRLGVGLADWEWEVPADQGSAPSSSSGGGGGVYGHGAVVLPGNVMMVYGGYETSEGGKIRKRRTGGSMFYNITSGSWSDVYVSPLVQGNSGKSGGDGGDGGGGSTHGGDAGGDSGLGGPAGNGNSSGDWTKAKRIGLGVGLGVGLLVLSILACLGVCWFRRRRQRRRSRDETLRGLSQGLNGPLARGVGEEDDGEMLERDHGMGMSFFPWTAATARDWYMGMGGDDPYMQGRRSLGYESLRGGYRPSSSSSSSSLYMPPPPSASTFSHRPKAAKGLHHQPSSSYDFTPLTRGPNRIEPIYEADEDSEGDLGKNYPLGPDKEERVGNDTDHDDDDDPFLTPTLSTPTGGAFPRPHTANSSPRNSGSPTPPAAQRKKQQQQPAEETKLAAAAGGGGGQEQHPDVQGWVHEVENLAAGPSPSPPSPTSSSSQPPSPPPPPTSTVATVISRVSSLRRGASARSSRQPDSPSSPPSAAASSSSSGATDDGRTGSNLSERSAFSFVPASGGGGRGSAGAEDRVLLSRLRTTLAAAGATGGGVGGGGGGDGRLGSSGSSSGGSSGRSYNTARSSFAVLQAEGPRLLLGRRGEEEEEEEEGEGEGEGEEEEQQQQQEGETDGDYVYVPGSPSKSKARRSWFGSLRRVFSGGTPESGSHASGSSLGGDSPTREGLLSGAKGASSSDYGGRPYGGAGLQRRRHGREAWLGGGDGDGDGDDEEWERDLERAAEQRTVQIMFTVPREPLRVVNAEVEREESVLIVDPEEEEEKKKKKDDNDDDKTNKTAPAAPGDGPPSRKETPEPSAIPDPPPPWLAPADPRTEQDDRAANRLSTATSEPPPVGVSPSPSLRAPSIGSTTLHTAEAVRLERPRTRVLEMVESFESRSREGSREPSPTGSPVRRS